MSSMANGIVDLEVTVLDDRSTGVRAFVVTPGSAAIGLARQSADAGMD